MNKTQTKLVALAITLLAIGISSANMLAYADPPSINISIPGNPTPPCTEGKTSSNDTLLCQNAVNVLCDGSKEGNTSIDGTLKCSSGKWKAVSTNPVNPNNPQTPSSLISKVTVVPAAFNPTIDSTKISYTLSLKSVIDLKITDSLGQPVSTLTDSQTLSAGSYYVIWYGTVNNLQGGTVLHSGTYHYKITAKNIKTNKIDDTKEGDINLIFAAQQDPVIDPVVNGPTPEELAAQAKATLALQNTKKGKTAKVGPDILIYSVFPLIGYVASRRKK